MRKRPEAAEELALEPALARLEEIVRQLESGDLSLEASLQVFEEGIRLSRQLKELLDRAEQRIEVLLSGAAEADQLPADGSERRSAPSGSTTPGRRSAPSGSTTPGRRSVDGEEEPF